MQSKINQLIKERPFPNWFSSEKEFFNSYDKEDEFCINFFDKNFVGTIVDFGAADLCTSSNSFRLLYEKKWKGILIEPIEEFYKFIEKIKNELELDFILHKGAAVTDDFESDEIILNYNSNWPGFSSLLDVSNKNNIIHRNVKAIKISTIFKNINHIDILSVDCEKYDMAIVENILKLNIKPTLIIIEDANQNFLIKNNYRLLKQTNSNQIWGV